MNEQLSALIDNEIELADAAYVINSLNSNQQAIEAWKHYHMIGHVMRGESQLSVQFKQRLMDKLEQEPTVLAPHHPFKPALDVAHATTQQTAKKTPAVWAIAASVAGVMAVSWALLQTQLSEQVPNAQLAQVKTAPIQLAQVEPPAMIESTIAETTVPNEYLMAHQSSAPTASAYYIQTASYDK